MNNTATVMPLKGADIQIPSIRTNPDRQKLINGYWRREKVKKVWRSLVQWAKLSNYED